MSRSLMLNRLKKKSHYLTRLVTVRDYTHMTSMKIVQVSGPPLSWSIYIQNSSTPWPWTSNFKQTSPFPNDNQSIKKKHNPRITPCRHTTSFQRRYDVIRHCTTSYRRWKYVVCLRGYYILQSSWFRSVFVFSINSLILSGYPLISFHLAEASLAAFSWLYTLECAVAQIYYEMSFIYNYSPF